MSKITINGVEFEPRPDCKYKYDYAKYVKVIETPSLWASIGKIPEGAELTREYVERSLFRHLILTDLWFITYFIQKVPAELANHPFWVKMCQEVENGPQTKTLDVWARYHGKSSIITVAETTQFHLKYPEKCTCIFSYKKPAAEKFVQSVKSNYESDIVKFSFPDVVYDRPSAESDSWSVQNGITLKRKNKARPNKTVEASGLVEGMLTGGHFDRKVLDDIETFDIRDSVDEQNKAYSAFEMSSYLGTGLDADVERIIGTFYSHSGPNVRIRDKNDANGRPVYVTRIVPGAYPPSTDGKPVFMSQEKFEEEKLKEYFNSQILCDPSPKEARKLNSSYLIDIEPELIPRSLYKVMIVDPAGDDKGKGGTDWAILIIGIELKPDELGASNVYLLNALIEELKETEAPEVMARMYLSSGIIQKVGVEKVAQSTAEIHLANALRMHGRWISTEDGSLVILTPKGREKNRRIVDALGWPLNNSKLHMSKSVPQKYRDRIRLEMDKFPVWKKDGIDALAYVYDIVQMIDPSQMQGMLTPTRFVRPVYAPKTPIG